MDSLLANYASSDDDEGERIKVPKPSPSLSKPPSSSISIIEAPASKSKPSLFSTLPPPKTLTTSSSVSLPPTPKLNRNHETDQNQLIESKQSKPLFSSLPQPKPKPPNPQSSPSGPNPKRVVQFTPPLNPSLLKPNDLDDEDDDSEQARKPIKDSSSNSTSSKALSSMLPAPKNSLCLAPTTASRRSAFDSSVSSSNPEESTNFDNNGSSKVAGSYPLEQGVNEYGNYESSNVESSYPLQQHGAGGYVENHGGYDVSWATNGSVDSSYGAGYESSVGEYGSCAGNWSNANVVTEAPVVPEIERIVGKRGRREIPTNIVEVNQAELIKNRPREDQVKSTGIAFGPAYQPVSTSKGKPSKLHKRKHQIGSLYFDMRQKESELAERRSKGFLTKAETQAKYGW